MRQIYRRRLQCVTGVWAHDFRLFKILDITQFYLLSFHATSLPILDIPCSRHYHVADDKVDTDRDNALRMRNYTSIRIIRMGHTEISSLYFAASPRRQALITKHTAARYAYDTYHAVRRLFTYTFDAYQGSIIIICRRFRLILLTPPLGILLICFTFVSLITTDCARSEETDYRSERAFPASSLAQSVAVMFSSEGIRSQVSAICFCCAGPLVLYIFDIPQSKMLNRLLIWLTTLWYMALLMRHDVNFHRYRHDYRNESGREYWPRLYGIHWWWLEYGLPGATTQNAFISLPMRRYQPSIFHSKAPHS